MGGSLVLNNIQLNNVPIAVGVTDGPTVLEGGTIIIDSWAQGNIYTGSSPTGQFVQSSIESINKPAVLLDASGNIFGKGHPQYADYDVSQFVSVKSNGAVGDGETDDTDAINNIFAQVRAPVTLVSWKFRELTVLEFSCVMIVCRLQDHLLRCWYLHCLLYHHHSCRHTDRWRGLDNDHGQWSSFSKR